LDKLEEEERGGEVPREDMRIVTSKRTGLIYNKTPEGQNVEVIEEKEGGGREKKARTY